MTSPKRRLVHGKSYTLYKNGCRCDACREYQRARVARNRADRLSSGLLSHGTRSAWDAGCRCGACLEAKREADREYSRKRRVP